RLHRRAHALDLEQPDVVSQVAMANQAPVVVGGKDQVVGVDGPSLRFVPTRSPVDHAQLPRVTHCPYQNPKDLGIVSRSNAGQDRQVVCQLVEGDLDRVGETLGDLGHSLTEIVFERRPPVLVHDLGGNQQSDQLALGHWKAGKPVGRIGVVVSVPNAVKFQRRTQPIAHELDVALNRAAHHFELAGQGPGVGQRPAAHCRVDHQDPFQNRPGRYAHRYPFSDQFRRAVTGPAPARAAIQVLSQDCSYPNPGGATSMVTPPLEIGDFGFWNAEWGMRNGGWRMADGKCRDRKGRPRFLGARKWVATSHSREWSTVVHWRAGNKNLICPKGSPGLVTY